MAFSIRDLLLLKQLPFIVIVSLFAVWLNLNPSLTFPAVLSLVT